MNNIPCFAKREGKLYVVMCLSESVSKEKIFELLDSIADNSKIYECRLYMRNYYTGRQHSLYNINDKWYHCEDEANYNIVAFKTLYDDTAVFYADRELFDKEFSVINS